MRLELLCWMTMQLTAEGNRCSLSLNTNNVAGDDLLQTLFVFRHKLHHLPSVVNCIVIQQNKKSVGRICYNNWTGALVMKIVFPANCNWYQRNSLTAGVEVYEVYRSWCVHNLCHWTPIWIGTIVHCFVWKNHNYLLQRSVS